MPELILVSAVYQLPGSVNGWLYRIRFDGKAVAITRVPHNDVYWNHGIIAQRLPLGERHFVPSTAAGRDHPFDSIEQAIDFIGIYKEAGS